MNKVFLSVVIPCYDEMANLQKGVLDKVHQYLKKKNYTFEVIIVDDGSKDGSVEFLQKFASENPEFRIINGKHYGKAGAVTKGVLEANGVHVLFTDMDQATPIEELDNLLPMFDKGYDIVIGSRGTIRKGAPWTRAIMGRGMILIRTLVVGLPNVKDTQCGFKMFRGEVAQNLFRKVDKIHNGFHTIGGSNVSAGFDVELLYLAKIEGYKMKEVPVQWLYVETRRVNPINDSIEGFLDLLRIKKNALSGKYKNI